MDAIIVCLVMVVMGVISYFVLRAYVIQQAEKNITNLLLSHKGIHLYVQETLIPSYFKYQKEGEIKPDFYAPELLSSSYIVRNQHFSYNKERENAGLPELYYKLAANNPRNPLNKADALEEKLIKMFNQNREIKFYREIIEVDGKKNLYVAIPFLENNPNCLRCHGNRAVSPPHLQERYLGEGGFNEKAGSIRAITSIRTPLESEYHEIWIIYISMLAGLCVFGILYIFNSKLRSLVKKRTHSLEEEILVRKQAEEARAELEKRLKLSQKMETIGALAGGVAHDFNNILSVILGNCELVLEKLPEDSDLLTNQQKIISAVSRGAELVQQILSVSRQHETLNLPIRLHQIIKEVIRLLEATFPATIKINHAINLDDDLVLTDPIHIHQIMMNLCVNGLHAMKKQGGVLFISTRPVDANAISIEGVTAGRYLEILVSDTGHGMDATTQKRIFEPYFTTKEKEEGTGLGLATVQGLVKCYKGYICVESEVGKGSTFRIYLPRLEARSNVEVEKDSKRKRIRI